MSVTRIKCSWKAFIWQQTAQPRTKHNESITKQEKTRKDI